MDKKKIFNLLDQILSDEKNEVSILVETIKKELDKKEPDPEFFELKSLLESKDWPQAVLDFQICDENSEEEKMDRAEGIVDVLVDDFLKDKKFLDFGCGEGHMAKYASTQKTKISIGYDIVKSNNSKFIWEEKQENFLLTTDLEKVRSEAPYDVVLIYDVLDHVSDPVQILKQIKSLLSEKGLVYLRCHPWCGRHGGHLYKQINKAFVHLVFKPEELQEMGYQTENTNKLFFPLAEYDQIIKKSGFKSSRPDIDEHIVEDFFSKNKIIRNRILNLFKLKKWEKQKPEWQMSQCFIDYKLYN